ncbi:hypothetical protein QTO34_014603 [Cnephaeus nilssonii]|uniref:LIM zinc-binding domain-containing protein n=1 Tax=Cnephaeus nilssonii TaxID=3371016 RepID=A0AA40I6T6_CNENI|nr:hypothetical protein QTO34_014603 [Eptesicus nilssonii]
MTAGSWRLWGEQQRLIQSQLMKLIPAFEGYYAGNTLEQCSVCSKPIMERILRATGKAYHPHCFTCVMCHRSLDGIPFTVDAGGLIHCIEDFHK